MQQTRMTPRASQSTGLLLAALAVCGVAAVWGWNSAHEEVSVVSSGVTSSELAGVAVGSPRPVAAGAAATRADVVGASEELTVDRVRTLALEWSGRSWSDAVAWAEGLPAGELREVGFLTLALEAARVEPLKALALGLKMAPTADREGMMVNAATQLATQEPDLAAQWAAGLPNSRLRDRMLSQVAAVWGERDPRAASTMVLEQLAAGQSRNNALVGIVQRWVQVQPEAAASWAVSFPEGALRDASVDNAVRVWADHDLRGAGEWLVRLPPGRARDVGVSSYVEKLLVADPVSAESWAVAIGDSQLRQHGLEAVARSRRGSGD